MKSRLHYASNAALMIGMGIIGYIIYAAANHQMSFNKLILFIVGAVGVAAFLLYRIFSRIDTLRGDKPVPRYKRRYRVLSAILLVSGLAGAYHFCAQTLKSWQQPALYWRYVETAPPAPNQYEGVWELGNQSYAQFVRVHRIQLRALADIPLTPSAPNLTFFSRMDSVPLFARADQTTHTWSFAAPEYFDIAPLAYRNFHLSIDLHPRFAVYELSADYEILTEDGANGSQTLQRKAAVFQQYLAVESGRGELWSFAELAKHAQFPSAHTREAVIAALGRSRHPQALHTLLELLPVRDLVVQNAVCRALAELGDARATSALIRLAQYEQNPQALRALGALNTEEGIAFLIKVVKDRQKEKEPFWRATAAHVLGEVRAQQAVPALVEILREQDTSEDFTLRREALVALAHIDNKAATEFVVEMSNGPIESQWVPVLLEIMPKLEHEKMLPLLAVWLSRWRSYDLGMEEVQAILDFIVTGSHHDLVGVLIDVLMREPNAETQHLFVAALSRLAGEDFGQIQYPALNTESHASNRRVINSWNNWWGRARREPLYLEQISPPETANRI